MHSVFITVTMVLLLFASVSRAQRSFSINTRDGLSTNVTTQLLRDSRNNMWIASYNGLHKHEGNSIIPYNRTGIEGFSMSSGEIYALFEDSAGHIWAGTAGGIDRIDPLTGRITNYYLRHPDSAIVHAGYYYAVFEDREGMIWTSTDAALFRLDPLTGVSGRIPTARDSSGVPAHVTGYVTGLGDERGFWIQTSMSLVFYEYATGDFYHRYHNPSNDPVFQFSQPSIGANGGLCLDSLNNLYFIAGHRLLVRYNLTSARLDTFPVPFPDEAWRCCVSLALDSHGHIWVGTRMGGVLVYNFASETWTPMRFEGPGSLISSNYIHSLCEDYTGRMWVATDDGVDVITFHDQSLRISALHGRYDATGQATESGILSCDGHSKVFMRHANSGFIMHDLAAQRTVHYNMPAGYGRISYVYPLANDRLWLTEGRGLVEATLRNGGLQITPLRQTFEPMLRATSGYVAWIYMHNPQSIYFKKSNGNLYHYHGSDTLEVIRSTGFWRQACVSADSSYLWYVLPDGNIARRHLGTGSTERMDLLRHLRYTDFTYNVVREMLDDGLGNLWISSVNGILVYTYDADTLRVFTQADGLSHGFNFALARDRDGNVWTFNLGGIDVFDQQNKRINHLYALDNGNYLDAFGSAQMLSDGRIVFYVRGMLFIVDPAHAGSVKHAPLEFQWQEMQINENPVGMAMTNGPWHMPYHHNRLSFRFSLLDFEQPQTTSFEYRLTGLDPGWVSLGNRNTLSLMALPPGRFKLEVRAVAPGHELTSNTLSHTFTILPPFYATWWFRVVASLMLLSAFIVYLRWRIHTINRKNAIKQQMIELEATALRAQMNPHFIFNCLNAIQECIVTEKFDKAYTYLAKFSKLLRRVLNHSEQNMIPLHAEIETLRLYLELESMRFSGVFQYTITVDEKIDADAFMLPTLLLQPIVENAIWHGLIHKAGDKRLDISFEATKNFVLCHIEDNGIGRARAAEIRKGKIGKEMYPSMGTALTRQRLTLLTRDNPELSKIDTFDLHDQQGEARGTRVTIRLPEKYD